MSLIKFNVFMQVSNCALIFKNNCLIYIKNRINEIYEIYEFSISILHNFYFFSLKTKLINLFSKNDLIYLIIVHATHSFCKIHCICDDDT